MVQHIFVAFFSFFLFFRSLSTSKDFRLVFKQTWWNSWYFSFFLLFPFLLLIRWELKHRLLPFHQRTPFPFLLFDCFVLLLYFNSFHSIPFFASYLYVFVFLFSASFRSAAGCRTLEYFSLFVAHFLRKKWGKRRKRDRERIRAE